MKIDKRECRKYAILDRKLSPANGILHAKQVAYIVITAIRNITHQMTLVLYIYPREQAVRGDCKPSGRCSTPKMISLLLPEKKTAAPHGEPHRLTVCMVIPTISAASALSTPSRTKSVSSAILRQMIQTGLRRSQPLRMPSWHAAVGNTRLPKKKPL